MFFNRGAAGKKLDYFLSFFQYYIYTKVPLPMDIEFSIQDTFALTRPQWKLASNLEEATKAFQMAVAQDQKTAGANQVAEVEEVTSESSEDEGGDADDLELGDEEHESASEEEEDVEEAEKESDGESDFEDETIVVTRQEEAVDPEDEADFEREYAKMMADSLESRKFERKQLFDVPLPVRPKTREPSSSAAGEANTPGSESPAPPTKTMAFSLLTKRGNRQQVFRVMRVTLDKF